MKKLICILIIVSMVSTALFASVDNGISLESATQGTNEDLFADVQGVELSVNDAELIEGEGVLGAVAGFIGGWMAGTIHFGYTIVIDVILTGTSDATA